MGINFFQWSFHCYYGNSHRGYFQLKHLSNSNRLQGLLKVFDNIESERYNILLDEVHKEIGSSLISVGKNKVCFCIQP